jgi:hypothetical protein
LKGLILYSASEPLPSELQSDSYAAYEKYASLRKHVELL